MSAVFIIAAIMAEESPQFQKFTVTMAIFLGL